MLTNEVHIQVRIYINSLKDSFFPTDSWEPSKEIKALQLLDILSVFHNYLIQVYLLAQMSFCFLPFKEISKFFNLQELHMVQSMIMKNTTRPYLPNLFFLTCKSCFHVEASSH